MLCSSLSLWSLHHSYLSVLQRLEARSPPLLGRLGVIGTSMGTQVGKRQEPLGLRLHLCKMEMTPSSVAPRMTVVVPLDFREKTHPWMSLRPQPPASSRDQCESERQGPRSTSHNVPEATSSYLARHGSG